MTSRTASFQVNALSFDVEHWHEAALLQQSVTNPTDYIDDSVSTVLEILDRHDVTATFFVVGELAREYPDLVDRINAAGHELGSHGHVHESVSAFTPSSFRENIERSAAAIADASGVRPSAFRAPNFSISPETAWAFDILAESDYAYDSSVFPMSTPLYGVSDGANHPYEVRGDNPFDATPALHLGDAPEHELIEVPVAVAGRRPKIPISGGFYARVLPAALMEWGIRWLNRRSLPATLYFHPWEFNPDVITSAPRIDERLISFYGIDSLADKLERLLEAFTFGSIEDVLADQGWKGSDRREREPTSVASRDDEFADGDEIDGVPSGKTRGSVGGSHAAE